MSHRALPVALALWAISASTAAAQAPAPLPPWIAQDEEARTVSLTLEVTAAADGGSGVLNGHHHGDIQVVVPLGWTVRWSWRNADSTQRHSLVLMVEREKLPTEGGRAAFDNAMSRLVTQGLGPGQKDETTFTAEEAGWYWLLCGVPGHALKGEWIGFKVDREAKRAGLVIK
jgi:uncharacterized cupredoxin-like copper-binding protein